MIDATDVAKKREEGEYSSILKRTMCIDGAGASLQYDDAR
jgi:hypothetical protein